MYPGMREFPHPFVTLRWFQCGAAGCAIVGKRPTTPLADELLAWEDATIELPDDPQACLEFVEALLQDWNRLNRIHTRNYLENLARHDWRLRIKDVFEILKLPLPLPLVEQLCELRSHPIGLKI
jgi:Glycosyl transferases group 1